MRQERIYRTEAVVLRRSDFGEADRLLTIYTPAMGKLRTIAKGVRKPISRKGGHLELFTYSRLLIARGRSLDIITQAETIEAFRPLRRSLWRATYACYAAELLDSFTAENEENRPLFDLFLATLNHLSAETRLKLAIRFYELRLLELVGYRPQLFRCLKCGTEIEPVENFFSPAEGGVLCPRCGEDSPGARLLPLKALKALRFMQTNEYQNCRRLRLSAALHDELERILQDYIVYLLERKLKSPAFIKRLRREMAGESALET